MTPRRADLLLAAITVVWGTTFAIVHATTARLPPLELVALRFALATVLLLPFVVRALSLRALGSGLLLGVVLFVAFATQTWGLRLTSPARSGFITGLYVVFVPVFGRLLGERISRRVALAVGVSAAGLAVLSWGCAWTQVGCGTFEAALPDRDLGDRLTLLCAAANAVHVIGINRWARGLPALAVNMVQLATVAVLSAAASWAFERPLAQPTASAWEAIVFLSVGATVFTFSVMLYAQPHTSPARASIIYSLEAVFAAIFSWLWLGEVPSLAVFVGGGLMMAAALLLEWPGRARAAISRA